MINSVEYLSMFDKDCNFKFSNGINTYLLDEI